MALPTAMFTRHYKKARTDLSTTITFGGTNYTAVVGDEGRGRILGDAGFLGDDTIPCIVLIADFSAVTTPTTGELITINSTAFRVASYSDDPAGICRDLQLVEDD